MVAWGFVCWIWCSTGSALSGLVWVFVVDILAVGFAVCVVCGAICYVSFVLLVVSLVDISLGFVFVACWFGF